MPEQQQIPAFRLYGHAGCPSCVRAEQFLRVRNIPAQVIPLLNDPVIIAGIRAVTGGDSVPILVSFLSNDVIVGYKEDEYKRVSELYFDSVLSASAPNPPAAQSGNPQQAEVVAVKEQAPEAVA